MGFEERGIVIKRARISYFYNYLLIGLVAFLFVMAWLRFDLTFALVPRTFEQWWKTFVVLGFVGVMAFLFEEPVIEQWFRYYVITNNEVILTEGVLRKNRIIIPHQNISNVDVYKGITGRIFDFGDVNVVGFKNNIVMQGIREPETLYRIINHKIALIHGTKQVVAREELPRKKPKKAKIETWRDREKELRKEQKKKKKKEKKGTKKSKKRRRLSLRRRKKEKAEVETEAGAEAEMSEEPEE